MPKILVLYYSWSCGNTEKIANEVASTLHADKERIETETPYPKDYNVTVEQGEKEVNEKFAPALKPLVHSLKDYDVIVLGTPTWWYTMAPAIYSFLRSNSLKGKTFVPFMTNGGWPGHVIKDMEKEATGAKVLLPKEIRFDSQGGDHQETSQAEVNAWINALKKELL